MVQVLHWETDPLLLDKQPVPAAHWVTANTLMGNQATARFLGADYTFNLYGIMVRKIDFVRKKRSDRILARFPFLVVSTDQKEFLQRSELLLAEATRNYFYKSINKSILEWRDRISTFLERGATPFPIFRVAQELFREGKEHNDLAPNEKLLPFFCNANVPFTSARGEPFKMPVKLTEELAYLSGIVNGDGNLQRYTLSIIDSSLQHIQQLKERFIRLFAQEGRIQYKTPNSPELIITNKWVVGFFSFLTGQPIDARKYDSLQEPLLFQKEPFRAYYWGGVMDADGSYKRKSVTFTSASRYFTNDFMNFLRSKKINPTFKEQKDGTFRVYIPSKFHQRYKAVVKCFHPEKRLEYLKIGKGRAIIAKRFLGFNKEAFDGNYFNFHLLNGLQVIGLNDYIKQCQKNSTQKDFARKFNISPKSLRNFQSGVNAIPIRILEKILLFENQQLMPFLFSFGKQLRFRMRRTFPVWLDYQPNPQLQKIVQNLTFYDHLIRISDTSFVSLIEKKFGMQIQDNVITNKVLRDYFKTFCNFTE